MSLGLGDIAPNFKAKTSLGVIDFYEYLGKSWGNTFLSPCRLYASLHNGTWTYSSTKR